MLSSAPDGLPRPYLIDGFIIPENSPLEGTVVPVDFIGSRANEKFILYVKMNPLSLFDPSTEEMWDTIMPTYAEVPFETFKLNGGYRKVRESNFMNRLIDVTREVLYADGLSLSRREVLKAPTLHYVFRPRQERQEIQLAFK